MDEREAWTSRMAYVGLAWADERQKRPDDQQPTKQPPTTSPRKEEPMATDQQVNGTTSEPTAKKEEKTATSTRKWRLEAGTARIVYFSAGVAVGVGAVLGVQAVLSKDPMPI